MAFMVKNPGLLPGVEALRAGDVGRRRREMRAVVEGFWRACVEECDGGGVEEVQGGRELGREKEGKRLFVADAIIANPPSFAHVHCAEKLGIPVHIMFT